MNWIARVLWDVAIMALVIGGIIWCLLELGKWLS